MKTLIKNKFIIFTFLFFSILNTVFGDVELKLNSSAGEVKIDESFNLNLDVVFDDSFSGGEVKIKGLENFHQISESNSSSFQNINGKISRKQNISLSFYPNEVGEFEIGPAFVKSGTGVVESNIIKIKVIEEKKSIINNSKKDNKQKIKGKENNFNFLNKINPYFYIFGVLIIIIFIISLFFKNNKKEEIVIEKKEVKTKKINFKTRLKNLEKKIEDIEKNKFYFEFNKIFKLYFLNEKGIDLSVLDLKEIKEKNIGDKFLEIYEKSYLSEFNNKRDTKQTRKKIIKEFLDLI